MDFSGLQLIKINEDTSIKPFDCGDLDLNDFLLSKAKDYSKELLAVTYILEDNEKTIAFFSIFNDSLRVQEAEFASKTSFKRFLSGLTPHPKRHLRYFPALKIGRLAVNNNIQKSGIGKSIISFIIDLAIRQNDHCACKLITVDAYDQSLRFYEKMNFEYLTDIDKGKDTRQMFLDLKPFLNSVYEHETI